MNECPYCLTVVDESAETVRCDACGAQHHHECWEANGGCSSKVCARTASASDVEVSSAARGRIVLSRESVESSAPRVVPISNPCIRCGAQVSEGELYCEKCLPEPQETSDSHNLWPVMVMVGAMGAALAWLIAVLMIGSSGGR